MSRTAQRPADEPGRRGEYVAGVLKALKDFYGRPRPRGRTGGRSAGRRGLAQRTHRAERRA